MRDVSNIIEILREEENSGKLISTIDNTKQKKAEQAIKHSLEFEKTISVISSRFIGSYENDDAIDMSLSEIGNFTGASRVYLFLLRNNGTVMNNTHEWCNKGVSPQKDILQNIPTEASPWWIVKLRKGEVIHIEDVSKMPEEASFEKDMLEKQKIKSLLVFPLKIGEKLNGFIGLDNVLDTGKWNYEDFAILRVCSEIIGNALERRQAEEALRESEEKLRSFMDSATDSFTLWDSGLNLIDVNKVGSEKFFPPGSKKEDVMGKNILDITPGLKETGRYGKYLEVIKTGEPFFADDVVPHPKFGDRYLSLKAFKVGNGLGMIVTDITERKKTEEKIKNILESSPDAIAVSDLQGNITECNEATLKLHGFSSKEEVIGKSAFMFFPEREQKRATENLQKTLKDGSIKNIEYTLLTKDGKEFPAELSVSVINDASGKPVAFVAITKDITERKKVEEDMQKSKEAWRSLAETAPAIIMTVNFDGTIQFINRPIEKYSKEEIIGTSVYDYVPPDQQEIMKHSIEKVFRTGEIDRYEIMGEGPEGPNSAYYQTHVGPILDEKGKVTIVTLVSIDITERKKIEERTKQQNKTNILRAEIWELAAQPLSENELIQQLVDKIGPFFNLEHASFLRIYPEKKKAIVDIQWRKKDSESGIREEFPLWLLKRYFGKPYKVISLGNIPSAAKPIVAPIFKKFGVKSTLLLPYGDIDNPQGYIATADHKADKEWSKDEIDIFSEAIKIISLRAEKVKAEEKAKNHQIKIEQQNIKLRKLDQLKSDFLNVTSHELRTPMASIKGYVQMLSMGSLGEITEEQEKSLEIVLRNINRLDRLIQDILDLSQLESGTMEFVPEETDLQKMIDELTETMRSSADIKDIKIGNEVEEQLPHLTIDPERIKQVIINLTNNAIKFSPDGSVINLKVKKKQEDVLFEVQDFGRGIPKDKQERVFETFYQVDSGMKRSFGGAGLGLSISKDIILAHGGHIWVESEGKTGKGSTFRFTLPIKSVKDIEERFKGIDVFRLENEA